MDNNICSCYTEYETIYYMTDFEKGVHFALTGEHKDRFAHLEGRCLGTKEMERCKCGGDRSKCDFYNTKEKENGKT